MTVPADVLTRARAAVPGVTVYNAIVPTKPPERYAVMYADDGTLAALAACHQSDSARFRFQITSVAPDADMASWVAVAIRDYLVDSTPTAPGWLCGQICHQFSERPGRDETVQEFPVVYKIDLYDLLATRL